MDDSLEFGRLILPAPCATLKELTLEPTPVERGAVAPGVTGSDPALLRAVLF